MTRAQHLAWAQARALEYLPHDPAQAVSSMVSDLGKHPELAALATGPAGRLGQFAAMEGADAVRWWVETFE